MDCTCLQCKVTFKLVWHCTSTNVCEFLIKAQDKQDKEAVRKCGKIKFNED